MAQRDSAAETGLLTVLKAITWVVYVAAFAAEIFLAFMFALQMLGADPNQSFVAFIYRWGQFFVRPFLGMIPPTFLGPRAFIDWNALVAIFVYAVIAWLVGMALSALSRRLRVDRAAEQAAVAPAAVPTPVVPPAAPAAPAPAAPAAPAPSVPGDAPQQPPTPPGS